MRRREFTTRDEAERYIAERRLQGKRRPRHTGGKWFLVNNETGTINKSLFYAVVRAEIRRTAAKENWSEGKLRHSINNAHLLANSLWDIQMTRVRRAKALPSRRAR